VAIPACLPLGNDAKHFSRLGIKCYGFVPMRLPGSFDFPSMFHGVDERLPVSALNFGAGSPTLLQSLLRSLVADSDHADHRNDPDMPSQPPRSAPAQQGRDLKPGAVPFSPKRRGSREYVR